MGPFDADVWQEVGDALRASPLRTLLTMAGVFWGTLILVLMLGFSNGLEAATTRTLRGMATNAVFVWGGRTRLPYQGQQPGRWIQFRPDDAVALAAVPGIRHLAPRNQLGGYRDGTPVVRGAHTGAFQITGDYPAMRNVMTIAFDAGRFVSDLDLRDGRKVAVVGREVQRMLFPDGEDPIGQYIAIRGVYFQIVGLFHSERGDDEGDRIDQTIILPFTTFQRAFNVTDVQTFAIVGEDDVSGEELELRVKTLLAARHHVSPDDLDAIGSYNAEEEFARVRGLFRGIRGLTWLVGIATVLSGAIGVSNVLMIVVRERTREIGLRRAIGATAAAIVGMIVQEAMVITFVAGGIGLSTGVAIVELVGWLVGPDNPSFGPARVDPYAAIAGGILLVVAGLVASVLPAQRAVAIEPVAALRAE
ncbi:MAG: ABC transporter permease [Myxococcota bacterium]